MTNQLIASQIRVYFRKARAKFPALSVDGCWMHAIRRMELSMTFCSRGGRKLGMGRKKAA